MEPEKIVRRTPKLEPLMNRLKLHLILILVVILVARFQWDLIIKNKFSQLFSKKLKNIVRRL
jgi:hypothetical protein